MGVDCTAYETAVLVEARSIDSLSDDDWESIDENGLTVLYNLDAFKARGNGMPEGIYRVGGKDLGWSRSYTGYGAFREELCHKVLHVDPQHVWNDYVTYESRPFAPLIHFADNEGFLGPKTCARLAADASSVTVDLSEACRWPTWKAMFQLAADTGVIVYT